MPADTLYIVIPCFNEEEALPLTADALLGKLRQLIAQGMISDASRIMLIDDGSRDTTWNIIEKLTEYGSFCGLRLSRNCGTQNAIMAGLEAARQQGADMVITTDADLQDDIDAIDRMVGEYIKGAHVVYGVRSDRASDAKSKRIPAEAYYKLLSMLGCNTVNNHSDFRLLSRRVIEELDRYDESEMFLRGVIPMIGMRTATVEYSRAQRNAGTTKYTTKSLMKLAVTGITSLSLKPLRLITLTGVVMIAIGILTFLLSVAGVLLGFGMLNWKIITVTIWVVGGIVTVSIGIVGEYVGRAYMETKRRPRYHIETTTGIGERNG